MASQATGADMCFLLELANFMLYEP